MKKLKNPLTQRSQLIEQRRTVDFDTYDVTVEELVRRVQQSRIEISPVYQRQFRWGSDRQSKLIESILLGIPVPPLFMATNHTPEERVQWEVVDGLQRLLTLVNFIGDDKSRNVAKLKEEPLCLEKLEKLKSFNHNTFQDLPEDIRTSFYDRPVKVIVLNDKSDLQVRFDLFERLNTGGVVLTDQEVRECVYRSPFMDLLADLANSPEFKTVVKLPKASWKDGTPEEYALRFFAYLERYKNFEHSVKDFLNDFTKYASKQNNIEEKRNIFKNTFLFLSHVFPDGLKTRKGMTPVNLFEGVSVGAALALKKKKSIKTDISTKWIASDKLRSLTTGATNSRTRVAGRIEFCRDKFLGA